MENLYLIVAYVLGTKAIGFKNKSLWDFLKDDMQNFVRLTKGNILIVGSVTFETFGGPFKNRLTIIVTRNRNYVPSGITDENRHLVYICYSLEEAVGYAQMVADGRRIYIAGGEQIYTEVLYNLDLMPYEIIATEVKAEGLEYDRVFPPLPSGMYKEIKLEAVSFEKNERNQYPFTIRTFRLKKPLTES
jgi:dihydrofolate reductase